MVSTELCPVCCEGHLVMSEKMVLLNPLNNEITVKQHGHVCDVCGTEIATAEDLKFNARSYRAANLQVAGRMTGYDIKALRLDLKISHKTAGQIFGGGPVAFCKYEYHDVTPTDAMDNLLWVANKYPFIVHALAERHGIALPATASAIPEISIDFAELKGEVVRTQAVKIASRQNNVYKMWEHAPIIMIDSSQASNELTLNFESAIAA